MKYDAIESTELQALRRKTRLLMLLDGMEQAGISPISVRHLHTYAYLANVLAPIWSTAPLDGSLLKLPGGPFYPALQSELDRLVGLGLARISDLGHAEDENGRWHLTGTFSLNQRLASRVLEVINSFPEEREIQQFLREIAYAVSALSDREFDLVPDDDATYSDETISYGNIVDFDEWRKTNYSANAAFHFRTVYVEAMRSELIHLYVRHLRRRINGER